MPGLDFREINILRDREPGEIMRLLASGLEGSSRVKRVESILGHLKAVDQALASAQPGDLVMIQADTAEETVAHLKDKHGAA